MAVDWRQINLEYAGASEAACDCCATATHRVWGWAYLHGEAIAAYFVKWTIGKPDHGASVDLIVGRWGEGALPDQRESVSLDYRIHDGSPSFMVVDGRLAELDMARRTLTRNQVIGTELAPFIFSLVDSIWMKDARISDIREWS
jgi:hypothetical protein